MWCLYKLYLTSDTTSWGQTRRYSGCKSSFREEAIHSKEAKETTRESTDQLLKIWF